MRGLSSDEGRTYPSLAHGGYVKGSGKLCRMGCGLYWVVRAGGPHFRMPAAPQPLLKVHRLIPLCRFFFLFVCFLLPLWMNARNDIFRGFPLPSAGAGG